MLDRRGLLLLRYTFTHTCLYTAGRRGVLCRLVTTFTRFLPSSKYRSDSCPCLPSVPRLSRCRLVYFPEVFFYSVNVDYYHHAQRALFSGPTSCVFAVEYLVSRFQERSLGCHLRAWSFARCSEVFRAQWHVTSRSVARAASRTWSPSVLGFLTGSGACILAWFLRSASEKSEFSFRVTLKTKCVIL